MKSNVISLKKPIKIIQVFRKVNIYTKSEKSFADRKENWQWRPIDSDSGYVKDGIAYLPESDDSVKNLSNCDVVVLMDDNPPKFESILLTKEKVHYFKLNSNNRIDIFQLKFEEKISLHLKYGNFEVGLPEREDIKLGELKLAMPIAVKINGKNDFSGSGRRARTFKEQEYIFEYLTDVQHISFLKPTAIHQVKSIPTTVKVVDLMKPLW